MATAFLNFNIIIIIMMINKFQKSKNFPYFASRARAHKPAAIGADAEVPVCFLVHRPFGFGRPPFFSFSR